MHRLLTIAVLLLGILAQVNAQALPERKILIRDGAFWYVTIDEMEQLGTLHTGSVTDPLKLAKHLALPLGRNLNEPVNPFCWDLQGDDLFAINFLDFPLNDRNEAIKKMALSQLTETAKAPPAVELLMIGAEMPPLVANDPYVWMHRRNNVMDHHFFDMVVDHKGHVRFAITNQGEMTLWTYDGTKWSHTEPFSFSAPSAFRLFMNGKDILLLNGDGTLHQWNEGKLERIPAKASSQALTDGILILNQDDRNVKFLANTHFDTDLPLKAIIENYAIRIL